MRKGQEAGATQTDGYQLVGWATVSLPERGSKAQKKKGGGKREKI